MTISLNSTLKYEGFKNAITKLEVEYKPSTTYYDDSSPPVLKDGPTSLSIKSAYGQISINDLDSAGAFKGMITVLSDTSSWPQESYSEDYPVHKYIIDDRGACTIEFYSKTQTGVPDQVRIVIPGGSLQGSRDEVLSILQHPEITRLVSYTYQVLLAIYLSSLV